MCAPLRNAVGVYVRSIMKSSFSRAMSQSSSTLSSRTFPGSPHVWNWPGTGYRQCVIRPLALKSPKAIGSRCLAYLTSMRYSALVHVDNAKPSAPVVLQRCAAPPGSALCASGWSASGLLIGSCRAWRWLQGSRCGHLGESLHQTSSRPSYARARPR